MSQTSQPVPIPGRESPQEHEEKVEHSPDSRHTTPGTSPGYKRKREDEEGDAHSNDSDDRQIKKRRTPPSESLEEIADIPRVGQIQKQVEDMKVHRRSLDGPPGDIDDLMKPTTADQPGEDTGSGSQEQSTGTQPKVAEDATETNQTQEGAPDIETDSDEPAAPADTDNASPARRRANGLKKLPPMDRPIEIDPQEFSRKRKASEKLAGSPFASPAAKRTKEDHPLISTITEEKAESVKNPSPPRSPAKPAMGFSAFASAASPFATVKSAGDSPFGGGTRPSSLFGGSMPKFTASVPSSSPFGVPSTSPTVPSVFSSKLDSSDPTQELAKETNTTPFPSTSKTPLFGASSGFGSAPASTPKSVFGRSSGFGAAASPASSSVGPTRRAKSPRPQAFGAYGTTAGRFAAPSSKIRAKNKAEENGEKKDSDEGTSEEEKTEEVKPTRTFSELLATTGSDGESSEGEKMVYTEQQTVTGEEEEMSVFHSRGKLYDRDSTQWKERGAGMFKLNINKETGQSPRIVMRRDGTHALILNAPLFKGMQFTVGPDTRYVSFAILDDSLKPKAQLLRFHTPKIAQDLLDRVQSHIPT